MHSSFRLILVVALASLGTRTVAAQNAADATSTMSPGTFVVGYSLAEQSLYARFAYRVTPHIAAGAGAMYGHQYFSSTQGGSGPTGAAQMYYKFDFVNTRAFGLLQIFPWATSNFYINAYAGYASPINVTYQRVLAGTNMNGVIGTTYTSGSITQRPQFFPGLALGTSFPISQTLSVGGEFGGLVVEANSGPIRSSQITYSTALSHSTLADDVVSLYIEDRRSRSFYTGTPWNAWLLLIFLQTKL